MAQRRGRATSRFTEETRTYARTVSSPSAWLCLCLVLFPRAAEAGLYTPSDQIVLLTPGNVESFLVNSTAAMVVEFYASWCGHCIAFSPVYKTLARDIKEWKPAVNLAAIDCAAEQNRKVCIDYMIRGYPSVKFFHAYSTSDSGGVEIRDIPRDVQGLRHKIIDKLEHHGEPWPPACPPLEPTSQAEIDNFFQTNNVQYLALIFEDARSYIGREVTLDLLQFENIAVRRVLKSERSLVTKLGVTEFPSCYIYYPSGNFTRLKVIFEVRTYYSYALQRLPGVVRSGKPAPVLSGNITNSTEEAWRPFNKSRVYMADLESALHYSLRVELSAHTVIKERELTSLKKYISVLAKYFPGRPVVMNLLRSVNSWLQGQTANQISYDAFRQILDNSAQAPDTALPEGVRWVGCQGSQPQFRRYPCGVWTLFHVLTVQAYNAGGSDPQEVLSAMRGYVHSFFGCRECAEHFENMARDSMAEVNTLTTSVLWLWSRHNLVNNRLAGALSEDPYFPKLQWPTPEMCSACHSVKSNGEHMWDLNHVLPFLLSHFSSSSILQDYLETESQILEKQREKHASLQQTIPALKLIERKVRGAADLPTSQPTAQEEEEEEEEEGPQDEEEGAQAGASEMEVGRGQRRAHKRPSIVGMRMREPKEDIVDLDSNVNRYYKAEVLQLDAASRVKQRTLQREKEQEPRPVVGLGMELDAGLGMIGLQLMDEDLKLDVEQRRQKRELTGQSEFIQKGGWISLLSVGFSKLDVGLCVFLYFLSSMCLLAMYLFFKKRFRLQRAKLALP